MNRRGLFLLLATFTMACASLQVLVPTPRAAPTATLLPTEAPSAAPIVTPTSDTGLPHDQFISELHMFDAQRGWAWTTDSSKTARLFHTEDGGTTWTDRSPYAYEFARQGASFLDADHAWLPTLEAVTNVHGLIRTEDGGQTWTALEAIHAPFTTYEFTSATDGVASSMENADAGNANWRFYETHDAGLTWTAVPIQAPGPGAPLPGTVYACKTCGDTASLFLPDRVILSYGDTAADPLGSALLRVSMDRGRSWNEVRLAPPSAEYADARLSPRSPVFFDDRRGVMPVSVWRIAGTLQYTFTGLAVYSTADGGLTWTAGPSVAADAWAYDLAVNVLSLTEVIVPCGSGLCVTSDAGQSWTSITPDIDLGTGASDRTFVQIDFVDLKTGWAVIRDVNVNQLYRTVDGGYTWSLWSR